MLEFLEKGVESLLAGDMSPLQMLEIQKLIEKYKRNFMKLRAKMNDLHDKEKVFVVRLIKIS